MRTARRKSPTLIGILSRVALAAVCFAIIRQVFIGYRDLGEDDTPRTSETDVFSATITAAPSEGSIPNDLDGPSVSTELSTPPIGEAIEDESQASNAETIRRLSGLIERFLSEQAAVGPDSGMVGIDEWNRRMSEFRSQWDQVLGDDPDPGLTALRTAFEEFTANRNSVESLRRQSLDAVTTAILPLIGNHSVDTDIHSMIDLIDGALESGAGTRYFWLTSLEKYQQSLELGGIDTELASALVTPQMKQNAQFSLMLSGIETLWLSQIQDALIVILLNSDKETEEARERVSGAREYVSQRTQLFSEIYRQLEVHYWSERTASAWEPDLPDRETLSKLLPGTWLAMSSDMLPERWSPDSVSEELLPELRAITSGFEEPLTIVMNFMGLETFTTAAEGNAANSTLVELILADSNGPRVHARWFVTEVSEFRVEVGGLKFGPRSPTEVRQAADQWTRQLSGQAPQVCAMMTDALTTSSDSGESTTYQCSRISHRVLSLKPKGRPAMRMFNLFKLNDGD